MCSNFVRRNFGSKPSLFCAWPNWAKFLKIWIGNRKRSFSFFFPLSKVTPTSEDKKNLFSVIFVLKFVNRMSLLYSELKKVTKKSPLCGFKNYIVFFKINILILNKLSTESRLFDRKKNNTQRVMKYQTFKLLSCEILKWPI